MGRDASAMKLARDCGEVLSDKDARKMAYDLGYNSGMLCPDYLSRENPFNSDEEFELAEAWEDGFDAGFRVIRDYDESENPCHIEADDLIEQYGIWGEHPDHPRGDWQYEVACSDTQLGYWEWVAASESDY